MGYIRPLRPEDIPEVARLHRRVFGPAQSDADAVQREAYLRRVFLPAAGEGAIVTSRVYEERGRVVGFLGVVPRDMRYMGKPVLAAVSSQFIVDPDYRASLVGIQLMRDYFEGPQDLSITDEANDSARTLWEGFGGRTAFLYSLSWSRPLRPARYALSVLGGRKEWALFASAARPVASLLDAMAVAIPGSRLRPPGTDRCEEAAGEEQLWRALREFPWKETLIPDYDSAAWMEMLHRAQAKREAGAFHRMVVKNGRRETLGWYLYYLQPGGTSEVVQLVADRHSGQTVLNHLLQHAWDGGAAAVSGRLHPQWMPVLSQNRSVFYRGPWVLVHSRRPDLLQTFGDGTAFFSRLEGEWCLRYR